jgi:hypothetical protein
MRPLTVFSSPATGLNGQFVAPGPLSGAGIVSREDGSVSMDSTIFHRHRFKRWGPVVEEGQGFDHGAIGEPQSQVIPLHDSRTVELRWGENAEHIYSDKPEIAKLTLGKAVGLLKKEIMITGIAPCDPIHPPCLHAVNSRGKCWSALEIIVRRTIEVPLAFHYISDSRHKTQRNPSERVNLIKRVNGIFRPQTCITFVEATPGNAVVSKKRSVDLGDQIDTDDMEVRREMIKVVSEAAANAVPINIFCVWKLLPSSFERTGGEMKQNGFCYFSDTIKDDAGKSLAHEIGHYLTWKDAARLYSSESGHWGFGSAGKLMTDTAEGIIISRKEADVIYATASDLFGVR